MHRSVHLITSLLFVAVICPAAGAADGALVPPATDDANLRVRSLFRQAYAAYNSHNYQESLGLLQQAWAIRPTYDVASALAQSEMKLQLYRDAANHLQTCLDTFAPSASEQTLAAIQQAYAEAKTHVSALNITTGDGVAVSVDGQSVGVAPLPSPIFVEPGTHDIVFKQGPDSVTRSVSVEAGADASVDARVEHVVAPAPRVAPIVKPAPKPSVAPAAPSNERKRILIPAIIGGTTFTAGLAMAVGFRLAADSNDNHADELRKRIGPNGCAAGMPPNPDCAELMDTAKSKDRDRNWSTAGIALSLLTLAAAPVYWYWPQITQTRQNGSGRIRLTGAVGSRYSGLMLTGAF